MQPAEFHSSRKFAETPFGRIAYFERGAGPVALFVHGVPLNGFHWRHVIDGLRDRRRCIALDLMGLGYTEIDLSQAVSFVAQARMLGEFLDTLKIDRADLVANDSGGAIAQIFAVSHPERLRTLTLTNCDTHDNWPPPAILPMIEAARKGTLADHYARYIDDPVARRERFLRAYANPDVLTDEIFRLYIEPLCTTSEKRLNFHRYWTSFDNSQTVAIEPKLRALRVPTQIVWALDDGFFDIRWAHWLNRTIPSSSSPIEVPDAKLFFPEDRPDALIRPLRSFFAQTD